MHFPLITFKFYIQFNYRKKCIKDIALIKIYPVYILVVEIDSRVFLANT